MAVTVMAVAIGCGKSEVEVATVQPTTDANYTNELSSMTTGDPAEIAEAAVTANFNEADPNSATEVVATFMDSIRRGGDADFDRWLTMTARQELQRIGHRLEPMGSPAATFTVTRAVPGDDPSTALVHSFWTEPDSDPNQTAATIQVVWGVQWEREAWRISGMAVQTEEMVDPIVLDFEDGTAMRNYLSAMTGPETVSGGDTDPAARLTEKGGQLR